jgi:hypothetical protein
MNSPFATKNRDQLITEWQQAVQTLAAAKQIEMALRNQVLKDEFDFSKEVERKGTENIELGNGYKLKAVFKMTPKMSSADEVDVALTKLESKIEGGKLLADRIVKWTPELSVSEYNKLPDAARKIIDAVVVFSPGTPSLEFVVPKDTAKV